VLGALLLGACGHADHPPLAGSATVSPPAPDGGVVIDGSPGGGPPNCGGQTLSAVENPPTLYFVIDRSGSMSEPIDASGTSKYLAARKAVGTLLRNIGHRVRYGAALYPDASDELGCGKAVQIFPPTRGDASSTLAAGADGPILVELLNRLAAFPPIGGTPTAAALRGLLPALTGFGERTVVVLATDGAPNCNAKASCTPAECIPDIEGGYYQGSLCGAELSCCDPGSVGPDAGRNCIDSDATESAVRALHDAGITTYVIGMPGSEAYGALLERLGQAGGAARSAASAYYAVADAEALTQALFEIGTGVAIECNITLRNIPADLALVNVYFDGKVVPFDSESGWQWAGEASLALVGEACEALRTGQVRDVQVVYGCQTVVR
jgi:hypothetical protein